MLASGLWQIFGTLIAAVLMWLLVVFISRPVTEPLGLGAQGVGIFNTALAIFGIFSLLTMGMGKAMSQTVSENISDKTVAFQHARNGSFVTIAAGIIIGVSMVVGSFFLGDPFTFQSQLSSIFFVIGIVMTVTGFRDALSSNLAAVGEYDDVAKAFAVNPLFQLVSGMILILLIKILSLPVSLIILVYVAGVVAQTLFLSKYFKQLWFNKQVFRFTQVDRKSFRLIRQGFYFAITDIIPVGILGSISVILLLLFSQMMYPLGEAYEIVGGFSIILGYSLGGLIIVGFAWPLITSVAEAYGKGDVERIRFYLHMIVKIFFYITFLILVIDIGLSRGIIGIFHGNVYLGLTPTPLGQYIDVWIPFMLVITAFAIAGFEYILCSIILGVGKGRAAAVYLGSIVLLNIGFTTLFLWLNLFPSPLINTALGFLVGSLIMLPFLPYLLKKHLKQSIPYSVGVRSTLALVTTLTIAAILSWPIFGPTELIPLTNIFSFLLVAIILMVSYFVLLVFFGAIDVEDLILLERKAEESNLQGVARPVLSIVRKIMKISPFCKINETQ